MGFKIWILLVVLATRAGASLQNDVGTEQAANVTTEAQFRAAMADHDVVFIKLDANITLRTSAESVALDRSVMIMGSSVGGSDPSKQGTQVGLRV